MSRSDQLVIRVPWPNFWAWSGMLCVGFTVWSICFLETDSEKLEAMFDKSASLTDRVQSAEQWVKLGEKAVPRLREGLAYDDVRTRAFAAYALARIGKSATPALPELVKCTADSSAKVRGNALYALREVAGDDPQVTKISLDLLVDPVATVRQTAQDILKRSQTPPVARLIELSQHENEQVRFAVLTILEYNLRRDPAVHELFWQATTDSSENVRYLAFSSLSKYRMLTADARLLALDDPSSEVVQYALRFDWSRYPDSELVASKLVAALERFRHDSRLSVQFLRAMSQCGTAGKPYSETLVGWTMHRRSGVRSIALAALVDCGADSSELKPVLERLTHDSNLSVAFHAGQMAARTTPEVQQVLAETLEDRFQSGLHMDRASAVAALAGLSGSKSVQTTDFLVEAAADQYSETRFWAIRGLGQAHEFTSQIQDVLQSRLNDREESADNQAEVLVSIRAFGPTASPMLPDLLKWWENKRKSASVQLEMVRTLAALAPNNASTIEVLFGVLQSSRSAHVRSQSLQLLAKLELTQSQRLELYEIGQSDQRSEVRAMACSLLARSPLDSELVIDRLITSLSDEELLVRLIACRGLAEQGPFGKTAVSHLTDVVNDRASQILWRNGLAIRVDPQLVRDWELYRFTTVADAAEDALEAITKSKVTAL